MTTAVYWIHRPEHTDMFSQGYIGITKYGRYKRRMWEHKFISTNAHLRNAFAKYNDIVQDVVLIGGQEYCLEVERKLRPNIDVGWNIERGGNLPPSFKGKKRSEVFVAKARLRKDSEETKKKKSMKAIGNKNGFGHKKSEVHRLAQSERMKGTQRCLGKQNGLKYKYVGTHIVTGEIIELIGGQPVTDAGFHMGHVSQCANGSQKSHKGYSWQKILIKGVLQ